MQLMWDAVDVAGHFLEEFTMGILGAQRKAPVSHTAIWNSQGGGSFTKAARRGPLEMQAPW